MDRASKFLAFAYPVQDEAEAQARVQQLRKAHPKARHFCYALRLFPDASLERSSDDGEPSGSAGKPILGQLIRLRLTFAVIIVVRYFGGTKLGVPGLIEAYRAAAVDALAHARIVTRRVCRVASLRMPFDAYALFLNYCKQHRLPLLAEAFADEATVSVGLPASCAETDLKMHLHRFSNRDFAQLEDYLRDLGFTLTWSPTLHIDGSAETSQL